MEYLCLDLLFFMIVFVLCTEIGYELHSGTNEGHTSREWEHDGKHGVSSRLAALSCQIRRSRGFEFCIVQLQLSIHALLDRWQKLGILCASTI